MSLTKYFEKKARVEMPKCEYGCGMDAQYDFVDIDGNWRWGCTNHWMKHRATKQTGPGHARHLEAGREPPKRPDGYMHVPLPAGTLAPPQISQTLSGYVQHTPAPGQPSEPRAARQKAERGPRTKAPSEFQDMPLNAELLASVKEPRPGSVLALTLDLIAKQNGATLEEIQEIIGPKHNALKLLQWANENKGYGWRKDEAGKIHTVFRG